MKVYSTESECSPEKSRWLGLGSKVTGAAHIRSERPCQDAIRIEAYGDYLVAAVADGHGSDACPFSGEGAQAAVDCVHEIFADIFSEAGAETESIIENTREIRLPRQLSAAWRRRVEELHNSVHADEEFSPVLYGTTVLGVIASPEFIFALQLGDGDILAVGRLAAGDEPYWLIEPEYMPGNETHSLCMPECWRYMRTRMLKPDAEHMPEPELIMLTTDGYANSFLTDAGFMKAGADILDLLRGEGAEFVADNLEDWLTRSSAEGSGDDITMALVFHGCSEVE